MKHTNDTLLRSVASRLKQIRIERGLTQEVVTDRTKVNVGLYEVGTTNITIVLLTVLCNFYNVTLEEFFKGIEYESFFCENELKWPKESNAATKNYSKWLFNV